MKPAVLGRVGWAGASALLLLGAVPCSAELRLEPGVGTGLPYGSPTFGAGLEVEVSDHVGVLGGVGFLTAEPSYAGGARLYFRGPRHRFRPHASVLAWREGVGAYVGIDHDIGQRGGFLLTYGLGFGDVNLEAPVAITFGINYRIGAATSARAPRIGGR